MFWLWTKKQALASRAMSLEQENIRLHTRNRDLETEKSILEDRLRASLEDRQKLWDLVMNCLSGERQAYHMQINKEWQKMGEAAPYPDAPHMGDGQRFKMPEKPFINRPMMGSEAAQAATQKFLNDYFKNEDGRREQ